MTGTTYELIPDLSYDKGNFPYVNRYRSTPVYTVEDQTFFGTYDIPYIPLYIKDTYHQIKAGEEGRWDLISYKYYQTVNYWWLICIANAISDPFESPPAGTLIRVPSLEYITVLMLAAR